MTLAQFDSCSENRAMIKALDGIKASCEIGDQDQGDSRNGGSHSGRPYYRLAKHASAALTRTTPAPRLQLRRFAIAV